MSDWDAGAQRPPVQESPADGEDQASQARSQMDSLLAVANKLQEARCDAQDLNDRLLLYFVDMALYHVCERLTGQSDRGAPEKWN